MINLRPEKPTEVFLVLHETAYRPPGLEYEYMTGQLRTEIQQGKFDRVLAPAGEDRARRLGPLFSQLNLAFVLTDEFPVPLETARCIVAHADSNKATPIRTDTRVRESNLSYLTRTRFEALGKLEAAGDPNAALRDWMDHSPDDFGSLVKGHADLWNDVLSEAAGKTFALVLHIEGFLLYPTLVMGSAPERMTSLHIPRDHPVHIRLWPDRDPVVSFGDENYWRALVPTIFGQYD